MVARTATAARAPAPETLRLTPGALAVRLIARPDPEHVPAYVAADLDRAERMAELLRHLDPEVEVLLFPPWDCAPYDQVSPSRRVMGERIAVLRALAEPADRPRILVTSIDAVLQRLPPRAALGGLTFSLAVGETLDQEALEAFFARAGYLIDDRVDEPGEAAIRGQVIDVFPAGADMPLRIEHDDGRIEQIRTFDPATQRTVDDVEAVRLIPASELVFDEPPAEERPPGLEHRLPEHYAGLERLLDDPRLIPGIERGAERRAALFFQQLQEGWEIRRSVRARTETAGPLPPERLYLTREEWRALHEDAEILDVAEDPESAPPRFVEQADTVAAFLRYARKLMQEGTRILLAAPDEEARQRFARRIERRLEGRAEPAHRWQDVAGAPETPLWSMVLPLDRGFALPAEGMMVVAAADVLGRQGMPRAAAEEQPEIELPLGETDLALGDTVVHAEHGLGVLSGLETVQNGGAAEDFVRIDYAGDTRLMVPARELGAVWRYGSDAEAVSLDRPDGTAWQKRREAVEAAVEAAAGTLVEMARAREAASAPVLEAPARDYERFVARFPYAESPGQASAIEDVLRDLAAGHPMDRLVCGDVGFGKTEVALRAAAAAAFAGKQVALVAPTTVLVRQHVETFQRRFAGFDVAVGQLSRLVPAGEARAVRKGLADGAIRLVIGTHALAAKGVRFEDLGLLIIDEEQRFGAELKAKLRAMADGAHVLTLTATPIPRTLRAATVGLQDLSVIASPPARRQPVRTHLAPYGAATVRAALQRERRRGGQSFVVVPRIADIAPMRQRLKEIVPDLDTFTAHGRMPPAEIDDVMIRFADGEGDVLLATNIIESGLDLPRANTMLVWRPDRFGLAQLHQLRGRVGRSTRQGVAYLLTEPGARLAAATEKRLRTLEALDRLGAGFAISARDLDLRGAGDLLGEEQAGHVRLIGADLYRHLLERALATARGETPPEDWLPELHLGVAGLIPEDYVPEPEVRINLYARLARLHDRADIDAFADEIEDRFGEPPEPVAALLEAARIASLCRALGIAKVHAGPDAIALTPREPAGLDRLRRQAETASIEAEIAGERLLLLVATRDDARRRVLLDLLDRLGSA